MNRITMIFLILPFCGLAQSDSTGPFKLADFIIGKTVLNEFYLKTNPEASNWKTIDKSEGYKVIEDDNSYEINSEDPSSDFFVYEKVYSLQPSYENSFPTIPELLRINDHTKGFFINQMQFGSYVVNNICLQFYNDTLVFISYSGDDSIEDVFIEKYKHQGRLPKVKETKSACKIKYKNGKSVMDREDSYSLLNENENAFTLASLVNEYDEDCNLSSYINVEIYDSKRMQDWVIFCRASIKQKVLDFNAKQANAKSKVIDNF